MKSAGLSFLRQYCRIGSVLFFNPLELKWEDSEQARIDRKNHGRMIIDFPFRKSRGVPLPEKDIQTNRR
ncbi:hypothetical cytosolic protein [Syntrophus aciditrophicus SB]|uniref:Hypothetical cytosolic protein n=1 Tax=Syntrophus aciditrophicus (strain SB) TaxID=56780 RepID=Q2LRG9_SYNAS|nr:hypothetical cytosolic protein [Syntrophus aciditrophicus SB]